MKFALNHKNIIDLEYFHTIDEGKSYNCLHRRDRELFSGLEDKDNSDETILLYWVNERRKRQFQEGEASPGGIVDESLKLLSFILPLCGLAGGLSAGLGFFTYTGETPVNVFHFLFLFVFSQILTLVFLAATTVTRPFRKAREIFPLTLRLYTYLATALRSILQRTGAESIPADMYNRHKQLSGLISKASSRYGSLIIWPFFILTQKTMVAVNIGFLTATLFKIATSDLAFGWQSTISFSTGTLSSVVKAIALPWSWFTPAHLAYPSIEAIEGSKIILKEGIYHLASQDLIAWWPFLIFCLLFYGLLTRLGLLFLGRLMQTRSMKTVKLDTPPNLQLIQRIKTPIVSTCSAEPPLSPAETAGKPESSASTDRSSPIQESASTIPAVLLLPEDIANELGINVLSSFLSELGFTIISHEIIMHDYDTDQVLLQGLSANTEYRQSPFVLVMESWMVPTGDVLRFLKELRANLKVDTPLFIALFDQSVNDSFQAQNVKQYRKIWKQKIDGLGDTYLHLLPSHPSKPL